MAGESTAWSATARMLRRAGFGVTGPEVDAALSRDWPSYVDAMLGADPGAAATPMPSFPEPTPPGRKAKLPLRGLGRGRGAYRYAGAGGRGSSRAAIEGRRAGAAPLLTRADGGSLT